MAFDQELAGRIREHISSRSGLTEKQMFGGIGFLLNGNMCCGVHGQDLIVRLTPEQGEQALKEAHVRPFDLSGRPMAGWVFVSPEVLNVEESLKRWLDLAVQFAESLPAK
jgi:TfoX/Sxy family transcriptional regulator of competence genes